MVRFPVLEQLQVKDYQLYPGDPRGSGLDLTFTNGPWLVLGVNGLGKTTLLLIVRHLLSGPFWVVAAGPAGAARSDIVNVDRRLFAGRVSDGARGACATLKVRFGDTALTVTRRLDDLSITQCEVGDRVLEAGPDPEDQFRQSVVELMGVGSFADALRIFRYLTFVLDQRDGLIWDSRAQSEIFRAVFLPPDRAAQWRGLEGDIVSSDSAARNVSAALYKILQRQERDRRSDLNAPNLRARLAALAGEQDRDEALEIQKIQERELADDRRFDARNALRLHEQEAEEQKRAYERLKFNALRQAFAKMALNEQYTLLKIITDGICPACRSEVSAFAHELEKRQNEGLCVVCGSSKPRDEVVVSAEVFSEERASRAYSAALNAERVANDARETLRIAESDYDRLGIELATLRNTIDHRDRQIRQLQKQLPTGERQISREHEEVNALRRRVLEFRNDRDRAENELEHLLAEARRSVEAVRSRIEEQFSDRATDFLLETFRLVYSPDRRVVGQTGRQLEFPAFEVELTGGAIEGRAVRRTAAQVSLSQREYLDLAFRMAVMEVVASDASTLVVDGPETSLDAVFASRAGDLLASYARSGGDIGNRLLTTCNVVDTPLIPTMLSDYAHNGGPDKRVINLLDLAAPTAALDRLKPEYEAAYHRILSLASDKGAS